MSKITGVPNEEERKVAIYKSKRHAIIQCSIHALPVLGAITILGFNLNQYYSKYTDISRTIWDERLLQLYVSVGGELQG